MHVVGRQSLGRHARASRWSRSRVADCCSGSPTRASRCSPSSTVRGRPVRRAHRDRPATSSPGSSTWTAAGTSTRDLDARHSTPTATLAPGRASQPVRRPPHHRPSHPARALRPSTRGTDACGPHAPQPPRGIGPGRHHVAPGGGCGAGTDHPSLTAQPVAPVGAAPRRASAPARAARARARRAARARARAAEHAGRLRGHVAGRPRQPHRPGRRRRPRPTVSLDINGIDGTPSSPSSCC